MYDSWTCLAVVRGPGVLPDNVILVLKMAACDLQRRQQERMTILNDVCEGVIETEWKTFSVNTRSGVLFKTEIESDKGKYWVNFLLSKSDLERGAEILRERFDEGSEIGINQPEPFPVAELYEFADMRPPKHKLN